MYDVILEKVKDMDLLLLIHGRQFKYNYPIDILRSISVFLMKLYANDQLVFHPTRYVYVCINANTPFCILRLYYCYHVKSGTARPKSSNFKGMGPSLLRHFGTAAETAFHRENPARDGSIYDKIGRMWTRQQGMVLSILVN